MARHSDGKNNYAIAPWVIIVAVLAVLALVIGAFFLFRGGESDSSEPVAADKTTESSAVQKPTSVSASTTSASTTPSKSVQPSESVSAAPSTENKDDQGVAPNTSPSQYGYSAPVAFLRLAAPWLRHWITPRTKRQKRAKTPASCSLLPGPNKIWMTQALQRQSKPRAVRALA